MEIIEKKSSDKKPIEITVGDLFRRPEKEGEDVEWFMFIETAEDVQVINLSGSGRWAKHQNKRDGIVDLQTDIENGHLIHYPAKDYELSLMKKEEI